MTESERPKASRFEGTAALVTGASAGIGAAIARRLALEGASVLLGARREELCARHAEAIAAEGGQAAAVALDVTDDASLRAAVQHAADEFGGLDVVVVNAGIEMVKPFSALRDEDWDAILKVNLVGASRTVRAAMPLLARSGGAVVMVASMAGVEGAAALSAYAASKGGMIAFARSLAKELAPRNIRVNAVAPGMVETEMLGRITKRWTPDQVEAMRRAHPLGFGRAEDVAAAVAFLASCDARWITGCVLVVDGGMSIA